MCALFVLNMLHKGADLRRVLHELHEKHIKGRACTVQQIVCSILTLTLGETVIFVIVRQKSGNVSLDPALRCIWCKCLSVDLLWDMFLMKNPNDAGLASLRVLRNSRFRPRWLPFSVCFGLRYRNALFIVLLYHVDMNKHIIYEYRSVNECYTKKYVVCSPQWLLEARCSIIAVKTMIMSKCA